WTTAEPVRGEVVFRPSAGGGGETVIQEPQEPGFRHEVPLTGLSPATRYAYRLGRGKSWFHFQTQPAGADPFYSLMVNSRDPGKVTEWVLSESPDFVISLALPQPGEPDPFQEVRAFVPVFSPFGPHSPFLGMPDPQAAALPWHAVDWGGYRLVFVHHAAPGPEMFNSPASFFLVMVDRGVIPGGGPGSEDFAEQVRGTGLHESILAHNIENPQRKADFVVLLGSREKTVREAVDQVTYVAASSMEDWPEVLRLDMDGALVRTVPLDGTAAMVLRQPAVARKLTCRECRQLAENGAYEESVASYETFVRENASHYQVDDALFAIAQIRDEKLFDYPGALTWYQQLLDKHSDSALAPLARQRVRFITTWDEADFPVLAAFERIRKLEYAAAREQPQERARLLDQVDGLVRENARSPLAPVMLRWRAGQLAFLDPEAAVREFMRLKEEYPGHPEASDAWMAIGETWYAAGRYQEAREAFGWAEETPELAGAARAQAARSLRNIRRKNFSMAAWAVLALVALPGLVAALRSPGPGRRTGAAFLALAVASVFGAWLIQEEFSSMTELILLSVSPALFAFLGTVLSAPLAAALAGRSRPVALALAGAGLGALFFLAAMYLVLYHFNMHYLIVFGL
ncbi:MAG: tetratricopeptide repeat protein, partial [Pseudomonadota bacterium]